MATRCNIIMPGGIMYRHHDGYPSVILPDIAGWITGAAPIGEGSGTYEATRGVHGDVDYIYTVNIRRRRVTAWKRDWDRAGRGFARCNALVEARETSERMRAHALNGASWATPDAIAAAEDAADRIAGFKAATGYALTCPAPRLSAPKPAPVAATTPVTEGARYRETAHLVAAQIAKLVRADIRAAMKAGELPAGKLSIRSSYREIRVRLTVADPEAMITQDWVRERASSIADGRRWDTPRSMTPGVEARRRLESIMAAYNYDRSDIQSDYFDCRFHATAEVDGWQELAEDRAQALAAAWRRA